MACSVSHEDWDDDYCHHGQEHHPLASRTPVEKVGPGGEPGGVIGSFLETAADLLGLPGLQTQWGCCSAETPEARARGEAVESSSCAAYMYGEEPLVSQPVFPTILHQPQEAPKAPAATEQADPVERAFAAHPLGAGALADEDGHPVGPNSRGARGAATLVSLDAAADGGDGQQWAPGGIMAEIMANRISEGEVVDLPEIEIDGGARYTGQWLRDKRHGRGVLVTLDGIRYEGHFRENMAHGRGTLIDKDGSRYEGQWFEDHKHGHGTYQYVDGTVYEGQFYEDAKSGTGTETWPDGTKYQGEFYDGCKHGVGIYRGENGVEYEGQFWEDRMHGEGCYKFVGGRKYFGEWREGHMSGHGRMEWPNGASYEGGYEKDLKHGVGCFTWPDGRKYTGDWFAGKQHGQGISEDGQGFRSKDTWKHGELVTSEDLPRAAGHAPAAESSRPGAAAAAAS